MVSPLFRSMKSILETRPIYHKCDDTIRGHVFCSFLALLLMKELQTRMAQRGWTAEWRRLLDDLDELQELTIDFDDKRFIVRTATRGDAGKAIQAAGVALGPAIRPAATRRRPSDPWICSANGRARTHKSFTGRQLRNATVEDGCGSAGASPSRIHATEN